MRHFVVCLALLVLTAGSSLAAADGAGTSSGRCSDAEQATDKLDSWLKVHAAYQKYRGCDDSGTAERYADKIEILLAKHWAQLPDLIKLGKADPAFEVFVLRHLGEITTLPSAKSIVRQSTSSCPRGGQALCTKLLAQFEPFPLTR
jgi:hypothetical protein